MSDLEENWGGASLYVCLVKGSAAHGTTVSCAHSASFTAHQMWYCNVGSVQKITGGGGNSSRSSREKQATRERKRRSVNWWNLSRWVICLAACCAFVQIDPVCRHYVEFSDAKRSQQHDTTKNSRGEMPRFHHVVSDFSGEDSRETENPASDSTTEVAW